MKHCFSSSLFFQAFDCDVTFHPVLIYKKNKLHYFNTSILSRVWNDILRFKKVESTKMNLIKS